MGMEQEKGSLEAHQALVDATLLLIGGQTYVRCWPRVVGLFYRIRWDSAGKVSAVKPYQVNVEGEPDIDGILLRWDGIGQRFGVECKTGKATQSAPQRRYQAMITKMGGLYIVARAPEEALEVLEKERVRGQPSGS